LIKPAANRRRGCIDPGIGQTLFLIKPDADRLAAVTTEIQHRLRQDIVSGAFAFGSRLLIEELAARYGCSHMPIREALRVLHGEGLVIIEPNRGARVRPLYAGFIEDLFDMRTALETMLARRAAVRRTDAHLLQLRRAAAELEGMVARGEHDDVPLANRRFHAVINDAAGNPGALAIVENHWVLLSVLLKRYGSDEEVRFQRVIDEHQHLIGAIERQDAHAAQTLMGAHIEKGKANLLKRAALTADGGLAWEGAPGRASESPDRIPPRRADATPPAIPLPSSET
jgi:DNA-binding GntR family transcriptional regulator